MEGRFTPNWTTSIFISQVDSQRDNLSVSLVPSPWILQLTSCQICHFQKQEQRRQQSTTL